VEHPLHPYVLRVAGGSGHARIRHGSGPPGRA
jgi:hypothetical protein